MKNEQKRIKNKRPSSEPTKFAHFFVVLFKKYMVKKYFISNCFGFFIVLFPPFFL